MSCSAIHVWATVAAPQKQPIESLWSTGLGLSSQKNWGEDGPVVKSRPLAGGDRQRRANGSVLPESGQECCEVVQKGVDKRCYEVHQKREHPFFGIPRT